MNNTFTSCLLSLLFFSLLTPFTALTQTVTYTASDQIIGNPERGLQKYSITASNYTTTPGANNLSVSLLNNWKNSSDQVRVVFRYFLLEDFINADINTTYLDNMQRDFDHIRTAGFKVIVRFSYSDSQGAGPQQASKARILRHIDQIAPILNTNQDIIFSHQAGFIGTWGEWYYTNSTEFGTEGNISSTQWANRKEILDAMLAATPARIPIQVRYTGIKTRLYGSTPLTPQTAYQNTPAARIGFFNDAFLNNWGDQGTYGVNSECQDPVGNSAYNYLSNETQYLPMTGETNGLNPCNNGFRTTGANAVNEMEQTNWTTLNRDYHPDFWSQIIASNHYDEILRRLGYRFVLESSTLTVNGLDFNLSLSLTNEGFARAFKERDLYLVMKNIQDNSISSHQIDTDIRTWENSISLSQNFSPGMTGTFQLYLWMPDQAASLAMNPDYSIRLANENIWQATTGYNDLRQTVSLNCSPTSSTDPQMACGSYTWIDGNTYTASNNSATYTLTGANGCDSVVTLDLTILNPISSTDVQTACGSYTWVDGNTYTASNNAATYTLTGANGCDSVVTLDLTILNPTSSTDVQTACGSFTWIDGNTYTASNNSATYTLTGTNGCDSVVTLDLTILNPTSSTDVQMACGSYTWIDGNTYTASNNSATYTLTGANGCDSVLTLDLTILNPTSSTDVQTACGSYTWIDGKTYTASNNSATYTLTGANGCDSVVTLDLTILNPTSSTDVQTACGSYTWIDGNTYTASNNSATYTLTGANGCDSVVTLDLTILNPTSSTDVQMACGSYTWIDGNTYTASNNSATYTLTGANGCDSVVTLNLTINNVSDITTTLSGSTITANNGDASYQWVDCRNGFSPIDGETNISFTPSTSGEYAVIITENGCQDTSACVSMVVTDILNIETGPPFHIFPNPTSDQLLIQNPQRHQGIIEVFDASGKIIIRANINDELHPINTSPLRRGTFFVRIRTDQHTITQKILKL